METGHELTPTLWRTCRVLANPKRLALIGALIGKPPQTVGAVAVSCGLSDAACSLGLRQIQARGLCRATRTGRWVSYALEADPRVPHAHALLSALVPAVKACRSDSEPLIAALTAYTHPRRLDIVSTLRRTGPCTSESLGARCGISLAALYRHLDKLERRNVLQQTKSSVSLRHPRNPFARLLLALACDTPGADEITR
jgi:predicted transcriptional regulator